MIRHGMIRDSAPLASTLDRLDARIRHWPARWLVRYLCLVSAVAVAACIATVARAATTDPTADACPSASARQDGSAHGATPDPLAVRTTFLTAECRHDQLPSLGDSAVFGRRRPFNVAMSPASRHR